jgi:hypothetical protein
MLFPPLNGTWTCSEFLHNYVPRTIESVSWKMEHVRVSGVFVPLFKTINFVFDVHENIASILQLQINLKLNVV